MTNIAIVGTGGMANMHAQEYAKIPGVQLTACCDIDEARSKAFAEKHKIPAHFTDLDKMLSKASIDGVSVVTSDAGHKPVSMACLAKKKHVLCEKPLAPNYKDALEMAQAAAKAGTINMVNFSYRNSSAIHRAAQLVATGELGRIFHVQAHYLQSWLTSNHWGDWKTSFGWLWRLSTAHGSKGVLGDIGVHIIDFASYPVGPIESVNCRLKTFDKAPANKVGEYTLDANDSAVMHVTFAGGALGTIATTRLATGHANSLHLAIYGEKGGLKIDLDASYTQMEISRIGAGGIYEGWERLNTGDVPNIYQRFITSIEKGVNDQPDFARGAAIQKVLDACEASSNTGQTIHLADFRG